MPNETELKKAWNLIIDYCSDGDCSTCIFISNCQTEPQANEKIEVNDEK